VIPHISARSPESFLDIWGRGFLKSFTLIFFVEENKYFRNTISLTIVFPNAIWEQEGNCL